MVSAKIWNQNDREFFSPLVKIGFPIMLGQLISYSLNLIDSIMIGNIGELEYSAVALANQPFFIVFLCVMGISGGMGIMISQYHGKGDDSAYPSIFGTAIVVGFVITGALSLFAQISPGTIMSIYTPDTVLQTIGVEYLRIVSICYVFSAFSNLVYSACRNVGNVKFGLYCSVFAIAVNTFLNYCLIFGNFGFPRLGVKGAAIATVIARVLEFLVAASYVFFFEKKLKIKLHKLFKLKGAIVADFFKFAMPVMVNDGLWGLLASTHLMIAGRMGSAAVAAWAMNSAVQEMCFVAVISFATASSILISKSVGAEEYVRAGHYTKSSIKVSLIIGVVGGFILYFAAPKISLLYNVTPEALANAMSIFKILPFVFFMKSLACMMIIAILRGGGDTKTAAIIDISPMLITIPTAYVAGVHLGFPIWAVYMILMSDETMKAFLAYRRINKGNFIRNLTRDN